MSLKLLGHHQVLRDLTGESGPPGCQALRGRIPLHHFDCIRRRHDPGVWKSLENGANAKPVISVAMRDVDGRQVLLLGREPIRESLGLFDGHERIDEESVALAVNEGRRHRLEIRLSYTCRPLGHGDGYAWSYEHVPLQGLRL